MTGPSRGRPHRHDAMGTFILHISVDIDDLDLWRRVRAAQKFWLSNLHGAIGDLFEIEGWDPRFLIGCRIFQHLDLDPGRVCLSQLGLGLESPFTYDLTSGGDLISWDLVVERIATGSSGPLCLSGAGMVSSDDLDPYRVPEIPEPDRPPLDLDAINRRLSRREW